MREIGQKDNSLRYYCFSKTNNFNMRMVVAVKPADLDFKLGEKKRISVKNKIMTLISNHFKIM